MAGMCAGQRRVADHAGLPVAVHAHGTADIEAAVDARVNTIGHCTWMAESGGGFDLRENLVAKIKAEGIYVGTATSPNRRGLAEKVGEEKPRNCPLPCAGWHSSKCQ